MYKRMKPSIFILIIMVSLGPFGDTIYAPVLPELKKILNTDYYHTQLTITSYLLGYSISQILYGPFSDRFGRKPIMLIGTLFFIISSVICLFSENINTLIYARFIQGFGAAAGGVIATVAIKDSFQTSEQGAIFAMINIAFALAPAFGAVLGIFLNPSLIFWILLIAASILFIKVAIFFPETIRKKNYEALRIRSIFNNYFSLLKDHQFLLATFVLGLNISIIYACLITAPDIFINILKLNKLTFLYLLTLMIIAVILGSIICSKLSNKINYKYLINFGMVCILISGILLFYAFHNIEGLKLSLALTAILSLTFVGISFSIPLLTSIALENFSKIAGSASSLMGFIQIGIASITTAIMSQIRIGNEITISIAFIILPLIGLIIFLPYSLFFLRK